MKTAYLWIVAWQKPNEPSQRISADLFFSSKDKFISLLGKQAFTEQLVPVKVPDTFDNWDFIPDNY